MTAHLDSKPERQSSFTDQESVWQDSDRKKFMNNDFAVRPEGTEGLKLSFLFPRKHTPWCCGCFWLKFRTRYCLLQRASGGVWAGCLRGVLHVRHCDNSVALPGVQFILQSDTQAIFNCPHNTADMKCNSPPVVNPLVKLRGGKNLGEELEVFPKTVHEGRTSMCLKTSATEHNRVFLVACASPRQTAADGPCVHDCVQRRCTQQWSTASVPM